MSFHPLVESWFRERFGEPTAPQREGWPLIQDGQDVLIASPTGSGKTLAAFLCAIDGLVRKGLDGGLSGETEVLYISPLKALANDNRQNLLGPLSEIGQRAAEQGFELPEIRTLVRTGDTPSHHRQKMLDHPPHILVTTPESFFILLTSRRGCEMLRTVQTVILDEIHSVAQSKRGSHLSLSLERLQHLCARRFQRIGLSATQKPIETVASFLAGERPPPRRVDVGHRRHMDLAVEVPRSELSAVASHEVWEEIHQRIAHLAGQHRTTLVFVNTRRLAERVTHHLGEILGQDQVGAHHGSLAKETRLQVERLLKQGELRVVVATASLELGIDVGSIELVCQISSPRSIALALQRIGRSGHWKGATPKGRFFPTSRDDLLECAALVWCIRRGELDRLRIPEAPLDVLAQQIVAAAAGGEWGEDELFELVSAAYPYRELSRERFGSVVSMLAEGITTRRGRRGAYLHRDRVNGRVKARRGARLAAITSGGAIPDIANFLVKADPEDIVVGDLDEDFAVESSRGDVFLLGNTSWRIRRVEAGVVRVEDARGAPPNVPFWRGEAPGRTDELSRALSDLRERVHQLEPSAALKWLRDECGLDRAGAEQALAYVRAGTEALGALPSQSCLVAERFFDEGGGMQLVVHAPFGSRINKAWGLALRKRFCRSFNFELQAAATENGIVLSLSDQHSFPLDSVFSFVKRHNVRQLLVQALLAVPQFGVRWRWTATRALAVLRFAGGRRVPSPLQRMRADDLLASVFPEQAACLEHITGDIEIPDHPLVEETLLDCLNDAMDIEGLERMMEQLERGNLRCLAIDTREPSPLCHEILNANPYAFLDGAPLEERRTRAVQTRRTLLPEGAGDLAQLDAEAIREVVEQARPALRDAEEVHDALLSLGLMRETELAAHQPELQQLGEQSRVLRVELPGSPGTAYAAAERSVLVGQVYPSASFHPPVSERIEASQWTRDAALDGESALTELVRYRMECCGPITEAELAELLQLEAGQIAGALRRLEGQGAVLRGSFRPGARELEWCDRRLLARIHRATLGRLRREIEPVSASDFMRFLFRWQHVSPGTRLHDQTGLGLILEALQGFEAPAAAWEKAILPARLSHYDARHLDQLCLSGQFAWGRLTPARGAGSEERRQVRPTRLAPIAFFKRANLSLLLSLVRSGSNGAQAVREELSHPAREVLEHLQRWGASFYQDLLEAVRRLPIEVEMALWELVACGLVTADGFSGLRALIDPKQRLSGRHRKRHRRRRLEALSGGRWTLLQSPQHGETRDQEWEPQRIDPAVEAVGWLLLARWGVVFRDLLQRESLAPPWRELVRAYRLWEAQGKIRGGRFVQGFGGEHFALPEAVESLRALRRQKAGEEIVRISAADPLNLVGIITPGERVRPLPQTTINFRNGVPLEDPVPAPSPAPRPTP